MKKFLLPFVCLFIVSACQKRHEPYYSIDPVLKANFYYQVGSYWIYKDAISGETDSFVVWRNADAINNSNGNKYIYEQIYVSFRQYGTSDTQNFTMTIDTGAINLQYLGEYEPLSTYPFRIGAFTPKGTGDNDGSVIAVLPSYSVNGLIFDTVEEVIQTAINTSYHDTFYINRSAGIITMILHHPLDSTYNQNRIWELQRWDILR